MGRSVPACPQAILRFKRLILLSVITSSIYESQALRTQSHRRAARLRHIRYPSAGAQATSATPTGETVKAIAGSRYEAGWLHKMFFGSTYRELWAAEITVELLDMERPIAGSTAPFGPGVV